MFSFLQVALFVTLILSVIAHEVAHGWVAFRCGDPTAKMAGRLTANPIPHIDPFMTIIVPALCLFVSHGSFYFGAAKPVPVRESNLRRWPRDAILVALAGITTNLLIAAACSALYHLMSIPLPHLSRSYTGAILANTAIINVFLAVFNLIPIPPLDGSRAFRFLLEGDLRRKYMELERWGFFIIIILIQLDPVNDLLARATLLIANVLRVPAVY